MFYWFLSFFSWLFQGNAGLFKFPLPASAHLCTCLPSLSILKKKKKNQTTECAQTFPVPECLCAGSCRLFTRPLLHLGDERSWSARTEEESDGEGVLWVLQVVEFPSCRFDQTPVVDPRVQTDGVAVVLSAHQLILNKQGENFTQQGQLLNDLKKHGLNFSEFCILFGLKSTK